MSKQPEPRARRRAARRAFDWHQAAELLAQDMKVADVAQRIGCSDSTLARKRKHDVVFQNWLARAREEWLVQEGQRLAALRPPLHDAIEQEVGAGNLRIILWLADRLKLATPPNERTPAQELRSILNGLTTEELKEFEALRDEA